jgi:tripartite-type tricarboxylate transporter receptor subunit TctC
MHGTLPSRKMSLLLQQWTIIMAIMAVSLGSAAAQEPGRATTFVVPYSPGTGPDILARIVGEELQHRWNQPVVIENKPGASGNVGAQS